MARHHYETLQQVFDDAYRGLAAQGFVRSMAKRSPDSIGPQCAYRGSDGRRCAIGHCIPDEIDVPECSIRALYGDDDHVTRLFGALPLDVLVNLQKAHDRGVNPGSMAANLVEFANEYGLTIPSIGEAA